MFPANYTRGSLTAHADRVHMGQREITFVEMMCSWKHRCHRPSRGHGCLPCSLLWVSGLPALCHDLQRIKYCVRLVILALPASCEFIGSGRWVRWTLIPDKSPDFLTSVRLTLKWNLKFVKLTLHKWEVASSLAQQRYFVSDLDNERVYILNCFL